MYLQKIKSEGLAHLSYFIGSGNVAAVVDPRRDHDIYERIAANKGMRITHIFETHRNEDYVIGSVSLAERTGARIFHGANMDFQYGTAVSDGETFELESVGLKVLETPGHTFESISIVLYDKKSGEDAVGVFTGDALFIGDVGRTDFFPDRKEEVAGLLHDSIFKKLVPLGEHVIIYPAHGSGSVCGAGLATREFSTIGYEIRNNPMLKMNKEEFIRHKTQEKHPLPPYFKKMEEYNKNGAPEMCGLPLPAPMGAKEFTEAIEKKDMVVIDMRSPEAFAGAFIPGSLAIPLGMFPSYGGWFVSYDKPIGIVVENESQVDTAVRYLLRMGYDNIQAYLDKGLHEWETSGRKFDRVPAVHAEDLVERINRGEELTLLDVRKEGEFESGHLPKAVNIYLGDIEKHLDKVSKDRPVVTFCGSGRRAIIAASILKRNGYDKVEDCLGSIKACSAIGCPIEK
ncbi:MAG: MBL fold metallo-hydrolase [Candidatus Omnitrophica bacterium]|nr:MBL fold metallo-hydrolase [Candidatus Omnitrophota bacterium]